MKRLAAALLLLAARPAAAVDEIQVYTGEIAAPREWALQQHLNYGLRARAGRDYPGALPGRGTLNGTPELAYGVTPWYEAGLYLPFAARTTAFIPAASSCAGCWSRPMPGSGMSSTASTRNCPGHRGASAAASGTSNSDPFSASASAGGSW